MVPMSSHAQPAQPSATRPAAAGGGAWSSLTAQQQQVLAPLRRDWPDIDATRQQKWLEIAARMPSMQPEERQRIQDRMREWARMTPEERGRARVQFQEARQISPQERQARWDAYMALPADERRALARSATTVPKAQPATVRQPVAGALLPDDAVPAAKSRVATANAAPPLPKVVAPTVVQARPGASTTLITRTATPPPHAQAGQPKIVASPKEVQRSTLLPKPPAPVAAAPSVAPAPAAAAPDPAPAASAIAPAAAPALPAEASPAASATP